MALPSELDWLQVYDTLIKIVLRTGDSLERALFEAGVIE